VRRPDRDRPADPSPSASLEDLGGRPFGRDALDRWAAMREQVAMVTFFLFDPESWR